MRGMAMSPRPVAPKEGTRGGFRGGRLEGSRPSPLGTGEEAEGALELRPQD